MKKKLSNSLRTRMMTFPRISLSTNWCVVSSTTSRGCRSVRASASRFASHSRVSGSQLRVSAPHLPVSATTCILWVDSITMRAAKSSVARSTVTKLSGNAFPTLALSLYRVASAILPVLLVERSIPTEAASCSARSDRCVSARTSSSNSTLTRDVSVSARLLGSQLARGKITALRSTRSRWLSMEATQSLAHSSQTCSCCTLSTWSG